MRLGIFDPYLDTVGGGERYAASLAEALLKKGWQVDYFWPDEKIKESLIKKFSLEIEKINFVSYSPLKTNLLKRKAFENKYDLLFYFSDGSVPFMFGQKNILHFQVPFHGVNGKKRINKVKFKMIDKIVCNSFFTKKVIDKEYGVEGDVWYPPVGVEEFSPAKNKENYILAVGRFEKSLTEKRQDILVETFTKMVFGGLKDWRLIVAGGCSVPEEKSEILTDLRQKAKGFPVEIKVNLPFKELKDLYARAKIFWHAAGYGADEGVDPQKVEHFGMTTVEAMSAGCLPVVINKGGQKEIINHGENGFLWETPEELTALSLRAINETGLLADLSKKAIEKSKDFSKKIFYEKIYQFIS